MEYSPSDDSNGDSVLHFLINPCRDNNGDCGKLVPKGNQRKCGSCHYQGGDRMGPISTFFVAVVACAILWFAPKYFDKKQAKKSNEKKAEPNIQYEYKKD
jgi:hypothetical protein